MFSRQKQGAEHLLPSLHVIEKDTVLAVHYNRNTDQ